jgi:hypothetical protein
MLLDIGLDEAAVARFAKECADRRNDISHSGGARVGESMAEFRQDIDARNDALTLMYHGLLLLEIGISKELVNACFHSSYRSFQRKEMLAKFSLLSPVAQQIASDD